MDRSIDKHTILRLHKELDQRDPERKVFGSSKHQYRLRPPLPHSEIDAFEKKHAIILPGDYRYFITEIGDGGAGPFYGLFPFGQHDRFHSYCRWEDGRLVGDFSKPFLHTTEWNLPDSFWESGPELAPDMPPGEQDRLMEAWDRKLVEHYWNPAIMNGALPICHLGCATRQWLVVNGEQKGFVWVDDRVDEAGIYPLRGGDGHQMTFSDWYMSWLESAFRECS
jgi:hypothetical protein